MLSNEYFEWGRWHVNLDLPAANKKTGQRTHDASNFLVYMNAMACSSMAIKTWWLYRTTGLHVFTQCWWASVRAESDLPSFTILAFARYFTQYAAITGCRDFIS